jgi:hypothetical protein
MTVNISLVARNIACTSIISLIDQGTTLPNGYLQIRSGTKPPSPQAAPTDGLLLATLSFSNPAFGPVNNGTTTANTISSDTNIDNTGQASWFRIYNRDSGAVMDGSITATGGGGDLEFDFIDFVKGGTVNILSLTATMPQ